MGLPPSRVSVPDDCVALSNDASLLTPIALVDSRSSTVIGRTVVGVTSVRASLVGAWFLVWSLLLAPSVITSSGHNG